MEGTVAPLDETTTVRADPQTAIVTGQETEDAVLAEGRRVFMRKQMEASAIKPQQAAAGPHPKIAIGSLGEGLYRFLGQTILRLP
jgi:hypothetical protein